MTKPDDKKRLVLGAVVIRVAGIAFSLLIYIGLGSRARADDGWDYPIAGNHHYSDVRSQLQVLVNVNGFRRVNHFCIVASSNADGPAAEVYWPTEGKLISWEPGQDYFALLDSRDYVDLAHEVVPPSDDLGYKYIVIPWTYPRVASVLQDCRKHGNTFTVYKTEGNWVSIATYPQFASIRSQLQELVDEQGHQKVNDFWVIGQKDGSFYGAYVYWPAEGRLILWTPDPIDYSLSGGLTNSWSDVDLKTGVVDHETYDPGVDQMSRGYAAKVLHACKAYGERFTITKSH